MLESDPLGVHQTASPSIWLAVPEPQRESGFILYESVVGGGLMGMFASLILFIPLFQVSFMEKAELIW